jgi:hypothetical protein
LKSGILIEPDLEHIQFVELVHKLDFKSIYRNGFKIEYFIIPPLPKYLHSTSIPPEDDEVPYLIRLLRLQNIAFEIMPISKFQSTLPESNQYLGEFREIQQKIIHKN